MINVVGCWELGWNTPIKEVELWEFPLRDLGVSNFYMSPVSGITNVAVSEHNDIKLFLDSEREKDQTLVFIDEHGEDILSSFTHPENATYVFGKTSFSPMSSFKIEGDRSVKIQTVINSGLLWSHQAASIVLYDRMLKA